MVCRVANEVAVHGHDVEMVFNFIGHVKAVREGGGLVAALGHADGHVVVAEVVRCPKTVVIAVVGVAGIVGLQSDFLSVDACRDLGELDDFGVLDVGRDDNHHGVDFIQKHLGAFVGTADFYLGFVGVWVDDLEAFHHIGSRQPVGIAALGGLQFDDTRFSRQGQYVAADGGGAIHHLERDGQP